MTQIASTLYAAQSRASLSHGPMRWRRLTSPIRFLLHALSLAVVLHGVPASVTAQASAYANTDPGRPIWTEDALPLPRYALELYVAPRWREVSEMAGGRWQVRAGASYGLVPRTQIDLELPVLLSGNGASDPALAGVLLGAQYAFNAERRVLPVMSLQSTMLFAAGSVAQAHAGIAGLATKSYRWGRLNLNGGTMFGDEPVGSPARADLTRWFSAASVDRAFVRRALLVAFEAVARQPLDEAMDVEWSSGAGLSYQVTPTLSADLGGSISLTPAPTLFTLSVGLSRAAPMPRLLPGFGRWGRR